jgi:hypothetical protein
VRGNTIKEGTVTGSITKCDQSLLNKGISLCENTGGKTHKNVCYILPETMTQ